MKKHINYILLFLIAGTMFIGACKKTDYKFGSIKTPSNIVLTPAIQGAASSPVGDGSGIVKLSIKATDALNYKIFWGDGDSTVTPLDTATHYYTVLDTNLYTITVNAIGTAGAMSTISKQINVVYNFPIPPEVMTAFTNNSSKNWMVAADTTGNFGVGPASDYFPDYYQAGPNEKPTCAYAGVITFTKTGSSITINDDNKGQSFLIGAATGFYGQAGGDGCYVVNTGGTKPISFTGANTGGGNSPGLQFKVPGTGLVNFGTGGTTYQVISLSNNIMKLRNIGIDGNAWYQILRAQ